MFLYFSMRCLNFSNLILRGFFRTEDVWSLVATDQQEFPAETKAGMTERVNETMKDKRAVLSKAHYLRGNQFSSAKPLAGPCFFSLSPSKSLHHLHAKYGWVFCW